MRVLIVGDQEKLRKLLVSILHREGCGICEEVRLKESEKFLRKRVYDLILIDLNENVKQGYKAVEAIALLKGDTEVITIVPPDKYNVSQISACGVYDCIQKPFQPGELLVMVKKAMEKKQLADRVRNLEKMVRRDK